jgi:hypothetical protein
LYLHLYRGHPEARWPVLNGQPLNPWLYSNPQLTIGHIDRTPVTLVAHDFARMPRKTVKVKLTEERGARYSGVSLPVLLESAGVPLRPENEAVNLAPTLLRKASIDGG